MDRGYIKLWRKMIEWEWYKVPNTTHLFMYLLIKASYKDSRFHGVDIKAGQAVFGLNQASEDTGISVQSLRTSLNHLKSTNEITVKPTNRFSIITILNYSIYQSSDIRTNSPTNSQSNKQPTSNQQATNNVQEVKKERIRDIPTLDSVKDFFKDNNMAANFFDYYQANGWVQGNKRKPIIDWKAAARGWKSRQGQFKPQNEGWIKQ